MQSLFFFCFLPKVPPKQPFENVQIKIRLFFVVVTFPACDEPFRGKCKIPKRHRYPLQNKREEAPHSAIYAYSAKLVSSFSPLVPFHFFIFFWVMDFSEGYELQGICHNRSLPIWSIPMIVVVIHSQGEDTVEYFLGLTPSGIVVLRNKAKVGNYFW